jgi:hypothetical protein
LAIAAWLKPTQRQLLLQQAWLQVEQSIPPRDLVQSLSTGMSKSVTFDQWLRQNTAVRQYRRTRTGFGVLSRHVDGPAPTDFLTVIENAVITHLFPDLLPSLPYIPVWDLALQKLRHVLLKAL